MRSARGLIWFSKAAAPKILCLLEPCGYWRLRGLPPDAIRTQWYGLRAEEAYVAWIRRSIPFHDTCHSLKMGDEEGEYFFQRPGPE